MLRLRGLTMVRDDDHGPRQVVRDLDLDLEPGERLALLGANGVGKSSLLRHLAEPGVVPGVRVSYVCQDPDEQLVARTVAGEVSLGGAVPEAEALLAEVGLADLATVDPLLLSAGQKQRLQLAVALAQRPDLLLLDEPGSLQDAGQAAWVRERVGRYPGAVIWATQDRRDAAACARALYLSADGTALEGRLPEFLDRGEVAWLWSRLAPAPPVAVQRGAAEVARLEQVACRFHHGGLSRVDLTLRRGERIGLTGPNGAGKSTLLAVLAGLRPPERGLVRLGDRVLYRRGGRDLDHGLVALAPQFPESLFVTGRVGAEARLAGVDPERAVSAAGLGEAVISRQPHALSGGERRRLALALTLESGRPLILLDEPTAALDAVGRGHVAALVSSLPADAALLIASHDRDFLAACGCRVLALEPGGLRPADG